MDGSDDPCSLNQITSICVESVDPDHVKGDTSTTSKREIVLELPPRGGSEDDVSPTSSSAIVSANVSMSSWKKAFELVTFHLIANPCRAIRKKASDMFKSKEQRDDEVLMHQLQTMPIRRVVVVPNSTVLPSEVVQNAVQRAGILGQPLRNDRVQVLAKMLQHWYQSHGFILHAVTGATLQSDTSTAEIVVQEPHTSSTAPVGIDFYREMVIDYDTGELLTFRQFKERHEARRTLGFQHWKRSDLNTTLVPTTGRTRPNCIARALKLDPGKPFCWDSVRWQQIAKSGVFSKILDATPRQMPDGGVQLHVSVTEAPARHLEYGLGKSLYTGGWEGELDFEHANVLGGGETFGISFRQGAKDKEPSVRLKFSDGRLGVGGGYNVQAFSEYIGDTSESFEDGGRKKNQRIGAFASSPADNQTVPMRPTPSPSSAQKRDNILDVDSLKNRRGLTIQIENPVDARTVQYSTASFSLERTATEKGLYESIGSTAVQVGPFLQELPLGARTNFDATVTMGTRLTQKAIHGDSNNSHDGSIASSTGTRVLPYLSISGTTRQLLPLLDLPANPRAVLLALRHSLTASTRSLPQHAAQAISQAIHIRGTAPSGPVQSAVTGRVELRIPITLPERLIRAPASEQDLLAIAYGDWFVAKCATAAPLLRKSSFGLGLRKSVQGIPLQYDVTYSAESGKLRAMFGLGNDFIF